MNGASSFFRSSLSMSAFIMWTLRYPISRSCSTGTSRLSISTATTQPASSASQDVRLPRPGPISSTVSFGVSSAAPAIFCITHLSERKFCPNALVGRMLSFLRMRLTSASMLFPFSSAHTCAGYVRMFSGRHACCPACFICCLSRTVTGRAVCTPWPF